MTDIRALVTWRNPTEPPKHACSNTLYFQAALGVGDWDDICDQIRDAYKAGRDTGSPNFRIMPTGWQINVRLYDMADAKPRPIKAEVTEPASSPTVATSPREVALCLSYYGDRNLPSTRGRIYLGPFGTDCGARPYASLQDQLIILGQALSGVGGEDISWRVHSTKNNTYNHIRHIWVDDEWDTQRSRQLVATARKTADV